MCNFNKRVAARGPRGAQDEVIQTKRKIRRIEDRVVRTLVIFRELTRAETDARSPERARDHERTHGPWYDWLRSSKQSNLASAQSRRSTDICSSRSRCGNQGAMVKRTAFLTFEGKQETLQDCIKLP